MQVRPRPCRSLEEVPESVLPHFHEAAEQLVQEKGATGIVAAALAYISGAREITSRSLLSSHQVKNIPLLLVCHSDIAMTLTSVYI